MARSDLLLNAIKFGFSGDRAKLKRATEAIVAEERHKQHNVLANKLEEVMQSSEVKSFSSDSRVNDQKFAELVQEVVPQKTINSLILPSEVKQVCSEFIQEHFRSDLLRSYNIDPRNRILLIGPPGNGKTSLAEGIAESLMIPLLIVRYESIIGSYLGETASRLKKLIDYACTRRCVLFFDEFETLGKERGDTHETGEIKRVVSSLLIQIDALPNHVIVVGATNHPELLDRAVWRRFQIRMELPSPTKSGLIEWFDRFERRIKTPLGYSSARLAQEMDGANFAEVEEFGKTIFRQFILSQPNASMKKIVTQAMRQWKTISTTVEKKRRKISISKRAKK